MLGMSDKLEGNYCEIDDISCRNAKINHENSKQHKKQLADLKKHMKAEDAALFGESYKK